MHLKKQLQLQKGSFWILFGAENYSWHQAPGAAITPHDFT